MGTIKGDESAWQSTKIGAGCIPIETEEGWLVIYHGVINTCNGFVYRMGCALLDLEQPWKVLKRTKIIFWHHMKFMSVWEMFRMSYFRVLRLRTQKQEELQFTMAVQIQLQDLRLRQ